MLTLTSVYKNLFLTNKKRTLVFVLFILFYFVKKFTVKETKSTLFG